MKNPKNTPKQKTDKQTKTPIKTPNKQRGGTQIHELHKQILGLIVIKME